MLCDSRAHTQDFRYEDAISLREYEDCCRGLRIYRVSKSVIHIYVQHVGLWSAINMT